MENTSNNISFLLVTEAIKNLRNEYEGMNDRNLHVESDIFNLGRKPGFAIAAFMCLDNINVQNETEAARFIAEILSNKILGTKAKAELRDSNIILTFKTLPQILMSLTSANGMFSEEQLFWFKCYSNFIAGVFSGALNHFGYRASTTIDHPCNNDLKMIFKLEKLEGAWEFFSGNH
ncbi:hypothetical protein TVAG_392940 [Trichomonas vaginalis G3]|uniref:Uncharacterized protein n=1 Tax=Trichomonas vaginalis (strain ATCC PRA-98 / G3) TaxID=412133 RepID=A2DY90_TRIV3|nr:NO signaling/Golgi transport ligand-binding domain family [Trichomonas vaginalis G3]EAY14567.1 hypothetical protein TVAG_392940 [Trichomonas vaginalis G3]KAI5526577.1 NO signaling/Golgi transport ligand-binding domain family [Trichomonas vaginalis G3]|eukprot:XP_001326790.1 hypothetical protein [Trichomonas vaginalis G3]